MQRDRDDVLVTDAACKLICDEDVPLSPTRMLTSAQGSERRTHKFALRIKIHRSDFLSLCHVRIWANGIPAYAFWRDAKVMCDGGYVYDAHDTRGRVLGGCNQSREQQLREVKVTYGEGSLVNSPSWFVRKEQFHAPRTLVPNCPSYPCLVNASTGGNMRALSSAACKSLTPMET